MKIWPFFRPDGDGPGQFFGGHDEDEEENVFDWCHMVVLGIKGLTRFLVRSDPYQKCGKHTQKRNDGKSLAPKVFSKRDDDGGGNFKKNFDNKPFEASWRRNTF